MMALLLTCTIVTLLAVTVVRFKYNGCFVTILQQPNTRSANDTSTSFIDTSLCRVDASSVWVHRGSAVSCTCLVLPL